MPYSAIDPQLRVGQYLWYTLQVNRLMGEFQEASFCKHTEMSPSIMNHMFENISPRITRDYPVDLVYIIYFRLKHRQ